MLQTCNWYILFIILLFSNCKSKTNDNTEYFNAYLKKNFDLNIRESNTDYILIPENTCKSCSNQTELFALNNRDTNIVFIFPKKFESEFRKINKSNILIDSLNSINVMKLHNNSISKIKTTNGVIDSIVNYDIENIEDIVNQNGQIVSK